MSGTLVHATCVALRAGPRHEADPGAGALLGVLLRGPSGAGKSDLALRLIDEGARLVADDQTALARRDGVLVARAPAAIAGRMEVRGVGIAALPRIDEVRLALVVDLVEAGALERLPEPASCKILGVELPLLRLDPFEASAAAKLRLSATARSAAGERPETPSDRAPEPHESSVDDGHARPLVLVTGMSGAGRSTALSILEDLGFESIDNLPLHLLDHLLGDGAHRPIAVGVDTRTRNFAVGPLIEHLDGPLRDPRLRVTLLFLDCEDEVLRRRYTETRRPHPLSGGRPLADGILAERKLISALRKRADLAIDTSALAPAELRRILTGHFEVADAAELAVLVVSFSYASGLPREADLVFDVRFLKNPHYDQALRPLTGRDAAVADYVAADPDFAAFFDRLTEMLAPLLARYLDEGKSYLTIALGCTGGRHRSVAVAERLARWLDSRGERVSLNHRDLEDTPPTFR